MNSPRGRSIRRMAAMGCVWLCYGSLVGCGGSGSGGTASSDDPVTLESVLFGRGIIRGTELEVVSPLTTAQTDPFTGLVLPETLKPLQSGADLSQRLSIGLGPNYRPVILPRNAVLILEFSERIDPDSVRGDRVDDDGVIEDEGSIQIRDRDGRAVLCELITRGRQVLINPVLGDQVGFPSSPVAFDAKGNPRADNQGYLILTLPVGPRSLRFEGDRRLGPRLDGLGSVETPIGINPGNAHLDFIEQGDLLPSQVSFNGFLPDITPPRIVREHTHEGIVNFEGADHATTTSLTIASAPFDAVSRGGQGEWAEKLLVLRPGSENEERRVITHNTESVIHVEQAFESPPQDGDAYRLVRAEFFEPDPENPIDERLFDPDNPENTANRSLETFLSFEEIDAFGRRTDANGDGKKRYVAFDEVPSRSVLQLRFSEAMDIATFLPYESFRVGEFIERQGGEVLGETRIRDAGRTLEFWPIRRDPRGESFDEYAGFGSAKKETRRFVVRSVPTISFLEGELSPEALADFLEMGKRGVTDLGGLPLAFPYSSFDPTTGMVEYSALFNYRTEDHEDHRSLGVALHLFEGQPAVGIDAQEGLPGVRYHDRDTYYGPNFADINLLVPGVLAGASVAQYSRVLDDQPGNHPLDDAFPPFPFGTATPLAGHTFQGTFYAGYHGARFQHFFRPEEASISLSGDLAGTILELHRASFAPIGGNVTPTTYEDISIHAAHSRVSPTKNQNDPRYNFRGLGDAFDPINQGNCQRPGDNPNYEGGLRTVVPAATSWTLLQGSIFSPPSSPHSFHPLPNFTKRFEYDNERGLVLEWRIRPQDEATSLRNGFTFSPWALNTGFPRLRAFSLGTDASPLDPDPANGDPRAQCASGRIRNPLRFGDNSRYFMVFDYLKVTSVIRSTFVQATDLGEGADKRRPQWLPPILSPPIESRPPGTEIRLELREASFPLEFAGRPDDGWVDDVDDLIGKEWIQFRVTVGGSPMSGITPTIDSIAIPYARVQP